MLKGVNELIKRYLCAAHLLHMAFMLCLIKLRMSFTNNFDQLAARARWILLHIKRLFIDNNEMLLSIQLHHNLPCSFHIWSPIINYHVQNIGFLYSWKRFRFWTSGELSNRTQTEIIVHRRYPTSHSLWQYCFHVVRQKLTQVMAIS